MGDKTPQKNGYTDLKLKVFHERIKEGLSTLEKIQIPLKKRTLKKSQKRFMEMSRQRRKELKVITQDIVTAFLGPQYRIIFRGYTKKDID